jgi:hypothetical protein
MKTRPIKWVVLPEGEPIFSEQATTIEIIDEAAGEFLQVQQGEVGITVDEFNWPEIKRAIDEAFAEIEKYRAEG